MGVVKNIIIKAEKEGPPRKKAHQSSHRPHKMLIKRVSLELREVHFHLGPCRTERLLAAVYTLCLRFSEDDPRIVNFYTIGDGWTIR